MRNIRNNDVASVWPVIVVIIIIGVSSFLVLTLGYFVEPGLNLMGFNDSDVDTNVSEPRRMVRGFFQMLWPYGLMLVILFASIFAMLMHYQKRRYQN